MRICKLILPIAASLAALSAAWCGDSANFCQPAPDVERAMEEAAVRSAAVTDPFAAWDRAAPYLAVRDRYPDSLFAHERYQDAIHEYGIEGHLRLLARQYAELEAKHPGDVMYRYLRLRATVGRNTSGAIQGLSALAAENADFPPAHRTLAEIYGTAAFGQPAGLEIEKKKFLAQCPGGRFTPRPPSLPAPNTLIDDARHLLAEDGATDRIINSTIQGLKEFEWRSQRMRAFDWYSREAKIQDARELRAKYWQAWPIQVRAYRKAGNAPAAEQTLATMEQRAKELRYQPAPASWTALDALAGLYAEDHQTERADQKLAELQRLAAETQDAGERALRAARIEHLRSLAMNPEQAVQRASPE